MDIRQQTTQLLQQWQTQLWQWVPNVVSAVLILLLFYQLDGLNGVASPLRVRKPGIMVL